MIKSRAPSVSSSENLAIGQAAEQRPELNVDDLTNVVAPQRVEEDDLVHAIQELRLEVLAQRVRQLAAHALV
jgi:hypothetical protein